MPIAAGQTPLVLSFPRGGAPITLELRRAGYRRATREVRLDEPGEVRQQLAKTPSPPRRPRPRL